MSDNNERASDLSTPVESMREQLDGLFQLSLDMLCIAGFDGYFKRLNPAWERTLGWSIEEMLQRPSIEFVHPDDRAKTLAERGNLKAGGVTHAFENRYLCKNGGSRVLSWRSVSSVQQQTVFASVRDVTDARRAEEELRRSTLERERLLDELNQRRSALEESLREKEVLLKEVHHRVKNNLQVVLSILKLHADKVADPHALAAFRDSQDRVRSIALLHEQLYQAKNLANVSVETYVCALVDSLLRANAELPVRLSVDADGISLPMDAAVPFGLILNELVMNALKHGRVGAARGSMLRITVEERAGELELVVRDSGPGFAAGFEPSTSRSLGMHLVLALAKQLDGTIRFSSNQGAEARLCFPRS